VSVSPPALGVSLPLPGLALHEHRRTVDALAEAGYGEIWSAESDGSDALMPLALFAAWRPDVALTAALINVFTRGPALIAMSAATLGDLAPGRARFCLGTGSDVIVESLERHGLRAPLHPCGRDAPPVEGAPLGTTVERTL